MTARKNHVEKRPVTYRMNDVFSILINELMTIGALLLVLGVIENVAERED